MEIRPEEPTDFDAIDAVVAAAFGQRDEADLVKRLRALNAYRAFVAVDGDVVGHIAFTQVALDPEVGLVLMGLAPLSVRPDAQRQGVGTALTQHGLTSLRGVADACVVLGSPAYYPRFGFAARDGLTCVYDVTPEHFMAVELRPGALAGVRGVVQYDPVF
ncbi:MAG: N-acetyltransferase [Deltaproteobacteria bacterium]